MSARRKIRLPVLALWGSGLALLITVFLIVITSFLVFRQILPPGAGNSAALFVAAVSPMIAVSAFGRKTKDVLSLGGLILAVYLAVLMVLCLAFCGESLFSIAALYRAAAAAVGAGLGIMVSVNQKKGNRNRLKRR